MVFDPLSPYLFILRSEEFSGLLRSAEENGALREFDFGEGLLSHVSFLLMIRFFWHKQTSLMQHSLRQFLLFMRTVVDELLIFISPLYYLAKAPLLPYDRIIVLHSKSLKGVEITNILDFLFWLDDQKRRFLAIFMIEYGRN